MDTTRQSDVPAAVAERWRFTADEYQRMGEAGILTKEDRVELLEGELYRMTPIGNWHNGTVDVVNVSLTSVLAQRAIVRVQGSFRLSPDSEPRPDILVLRFREDFYRDVTVGPADVLLLIQVADTSVAYDREKKLPLYARAGIPEVWIADRASGQIEVYRQPRGDRYLDVSAVRRGGTVTPLAFPDVSLSVSTIIG